jgi:4-amino-4-deoxy-L-arabinose transferase-like glycosyltransferase
MRARERRLLIVCTAAFTLLFFLELPGSSLLEPDEARYAEIPREMLASGDWLVPKLNSVDYFEKPPLAYWANALSIEALGHNSFAARLPSRLALLGVVLILFLSLRREFGGRVALLSGLATLTAPLAFGLGRTNLTDGVLTFWMTLALLCLHRFLRDREEGRRASLAAAGTGLACGLAVLTKGLIGLVLPGAALLLWCLVCRRPRRIVEIVFSWATPLFLASTVPYFVAVERAAPGFSRFFWIHEHFARYATTEASRPGPPYYFVLLFLAGFLPWSFLLGRPVKRAFLPLPEPIFPRASDRWFAIYAAVILVFFSLSHSKLPPYILPVFPAASVLVARSLVEDDAPVSRPLLGHALFWTVAGPAGLAFAWRTGDLSRYGVTVAAFAPASALIVFSWLSVFRARRERLGAVATALAGWAVLFAALIFAFPRFAVDQSAERLASSARRAAGDEAEIVAYRTYLQGFPWILERRLRIYGWKGELDFGSQRGEQAAWFPAAEDFWKDWDSGRKMVVLMRRRDRPQMKGHRADLVAENRKYLVAKNF